MNDKTDTLRRMETNRLMDVVKNHRQYGYDESIRDSALLILKERGIEIEELALSGNLHNATYDRAERMYRAYRRHSGLTFLFYILILATNLWVSWVASTGETGWLHVLVVLGVFCSYLGFLIASFIDQSNFYRSIGKKWEGSDQVIYFLLGMPLYVFMYFYYRSRMHDEMEMIR
jgi:hypothetical protein